MAWSSIVIAAIVAAIAPEPAGQAAGDADMPEWMAGGWIAQQEGGSWAEEWWTPAKAGVMLGAGRSGKEDRLDWWEHTRIERADGRLRFCALPKGQGGACFAATKIAAGEVVFENPGHDFPTRVAYRRDGADLLAEISGPGGANPQRWRFRRLN
ncbi:MAG TPA: DUF6265 family protein [Sphingomicrobium sp.]